MSHSEELFGHNDYRAYLNAHYQKVKRRNRRFSYGSWAKQLNLRSTSSLTKVLHGQRQAGPELAGKLSKYFEFNQKEAQYFEDLINLAKLKNDSRLSVLLMEKLERENPDGPIRVLTDDEYQLISEWYPYAVRQLVKRKRFVESPNWIAQQFRFPLTATEAKKALQLLIRLELLKRDARGRLRQVSRVIDSTNDISSEALKRHHEQTLAQASDAIRSIPLEERTIANTTFSMKAEDIPQAKEYLRKMRLDFVRRFEQEDGEGVFRVQVQFFPLTKFHNKKESPDA